MLTTGRPAVDLLIGEVFRLNGALGTAGDALCAPLGLSSARWQIMGTISLLDAATVSELARKIGLTRQSVQRVVTELANEQYVELIDNPEHKRAKKVVLSKKGQHAHNSITAIWKPISERLNARFDSELLTSTAQILADLREEFRLISAVSNDPPDSR
jgi:DNA-binding MarR family transcriptional regulator